MRAGQQYADPGTQAGPGRARQGGQPEPSAANHFRSGAYDEPLLSRATPAPRHRSRPVPVGFPSRRDAGDVRQVPGTAAARVASLPPVSVLFTLPVASKTQRAGDAHHPVVALGMTSLMVILPCCVGLSLRPRQDERSSPDLHEPGQSAPRLRTCVVLPGLSVPGRRAIGHAPARCRGFQPKREVGVRGHGHHGQTAGA
jgi:hypothetical protein